MPIVTTTIKGIILNCNESILGLELENGFKIEKCYLKDLSFKNKITNGEGLINDVYFNSQLKDDKGIFFMCLCKEDRHNITLKTGNYLTDSDIMCSDQLTTYNDKQSDYLHMIFSLLHLFKRGNIGYYELFLEHKFNVFGFIKNTLKNTIVSDAKNTVDNTIYSLSEKEIKQCNDFINRHKTNSYLLLKNNIDEFIWGLEQIDIPTGFEQYTTSLEMTLLEKNQKNKKEVLAKRISTLLETDLSKRKQLYNKIKDFYKYRSESLHEGDTSNITKNEMIELEDIARAILVKYLDLCNTKVNANIMITWEQIKKDQIIELKKAVESAVLAGAFS